jgi:hypothetical protein
MPTVDQQFLEELRVLSQDPSIRYSIIPSNIPLWLGMRTLQNGRDGWLVEKTSVAMAVTYLDQPG